jgi:hypothetical protein
VGNEANCAASLGKQKARGKALLETTELIFRAEDGALRMKIPFASVKSAKAVNGELRLEFPEGLAVFALGANAEKWCEKILHPKTRMEKIGVKANETVCLVGKFDGDFLAELGSRTKNVTSGKMAGTPDWIFLAADSASDLSQVAKLAKGLRDRAALWIVYPKGQKQITENDVLVAGRKCGLKDVKVVGFSPTHTALKFVVPLAKR